MMKKEVPFVFQNAMRNVYFNILKIFIKNEGLILDLENYPNDVILTEKRELLVRTIPEIVAIIESHSPYGEIDDSTNEFTNKGLNHRSYEGLKIILVNGKYERQIDKIANNMKNYLEEEVFVDKRSQR